MIFDPKKVLLVANFTSEVNIGSGGGEVIWDPNEVSTSRTVSQTPFRPGAGAWEGKAGDKPITNSCVDENSTSRFQNAENTGTFWQVLAENIWGLM